MIYVSGAMNLPLSSSTWCKAEFFNKCFIVAAHQIPNYMNV